MAGLSWKILFNWCYIHIIGAFFSYDVPQRGLPSGKRFQFAKPWAIYFVDLPMKNGDFPSFLKYV